MTNRIRGEIEAEIEGRTYTLCLTLGAMAEIESALGVDSIAELGARMQQVRFRDLIAILGALMRGGGNDIADEAVGRLRVDPHRIAGWVTEAFGAGGWGGAEGNGEAPGEPDPPPGGNGSSSALVN